MTKSSLGRGRGGQGSISQTFLEQHVLVDAMIPDKNCKTLCGNMKASFIGLCDILRP